MIELLRQRKKELWYSYEQIAELSDIPLDIVKKIFEGDIASIGYVSLRAISQVLFSEEDANHICEPPSDYKKYMAKRQGEYTVEDYLAWPKGQRIELIDGVIYDRVAPSDIYRIIALQLSYRFHEFVQKNRGKSVTAMSPIDVQLDKDDKTMVQPDVIIVSDRNKFKEGKVFGAPDLIVEVASSATRKKDIAIKLRKYQTAGVKEYWIVDPGNKRVVVYNHMASESKNVRRYSFNSIIPVGVFGGKCEIDFGKISGYIDFCVRQKST